MSQCVSGVVSYWQTRASTTGPGASSGNRRPRYARTLAIEVGDEGAGFAPDDVADPLAPENQMKTSGRGIFYMRTFMDEVSFSRGETGGTLLTLKKKVQTTSGTKGVEAS